MVHVGHNAVVEENAILIAQVGLAGSSRVGEGAILGGKVGVVGHTTVGAGARVAGGAVVWSDVEPGADYAGLPARPKTEFLQAMALSRRLPGLLDRIKALESRIRELEASHEETTLPDNNDHYERLLSSQAWGCTPGRKSKRAYSPPRRTQAWSLSGLICLPLRRSRHR